MYNKLFLAPFPTDLPGFAGLWLFLWRLRDTKDFMFFAGARRNLQTLHYNVERHFGELTVGCPNAKRSTLFTDAFLRKYTNEEDAKEENSPCSSLENTLIQMGSLTYTQWKQSIEYDVYPLVSANSKLSNHED